MNNSRDNVEFYKSIETAFIDSTVNSSLALRPQFVSNNYAEGKKVLTSLEDELKTCDAFFFSVAFITRSGIEPLLQIFQELEKKGVPGKIITTDYLNFTEPKALKTLNGLSNIQLKMYVTSGSGDVVFDAETGVNPALHEGFHTKGYIFKNGEMYRIIVGSSNLTQSALTKNKEWNTRVVSTEAGEFAGKILSEFDQLWNAPNALKFDDFYAEYKAQYDIIKAQKKAAKEEADKTGAVNISKYRLKPNKMQTAFVASLKKMVDAGEKKGLLISSTGTGKTYASSFAMRDLRFKKVLFLVHRNQIAKQALKSYRNVFAGDRSMALLSGSVTGSEREKAMASDYVFATIQTMSKDDILYQFDPMNFDAIVFDEAHHSSADSYKKVMGYFKPQFTLGMTATPDRRDDNMDGRNIYEIFDHNIAYEIRLQQAMEEDLLCPFHYFGITDLELVDDDVQTINATALKSASAGNKDPESVKALRRFNYLTSNERVDYVMKQANYYGYSGDRVKGLIFVSRINEAIELSKKFNEKGWRTIVLSGADAEEARAEAIDRLVMEEAEEALDYIISVDLFSEGVDIPEINQVIMLRPTESPIVFIQQLGRGLRKADEKEFVVVLDFIGNYKNNFMIPVALSGDRTYNKDNIRHYLQEGNRIIPGASTLHFDEISRKRIFSSIDDANFSDIRLIKMNYQNLKDKLGRIPKLADFDEHGEMDVLRIFDNKNLGSYYKFLVKYEKDYKIRLNADEEKVIEFVSKKLANGKRLDELEILRRSLLARDNLLKQWKQSTDAKYGKTLSSLKKKSVVNVLTNEFPSGSGKATYDKCVFLEPQPNGEDYRVTAGYGKMLDNHDFADVLNELIDFGISRYERDYSKQYKDTGFVLYQKYTYEDACRILNWDHNEVPLNIGGYKFDKGTKTFPVFINYEKSDDVVDTQRYEDRFTSRSTLISISKSGRSVSSEDVQNFLHAKERGIDVQLFIRKNKDDKISKEFYYLGRMTATGRTEELTLKNTDKTVVEMEWNLDVPVREDLYQYLVSE